MVEVIALIPARGGSKSIPRKNIKMLAGHPLIAYSIIAGKASHLVTRTIVSTDDEEIAAMAKRYGAEVPFMRPVELAQDDTTDYPVIDQAIRWLAEHEECRPEIVVQLRPTSPIRPRGIVDEAIDILINHPEADSVRGVIPSGQNPYKMWRVNDHGQMTPLLSLPGILEPFNSPRQALPQTYWQTGHIDAIRVNSIRKYSSLSGSTILPLFIDPHFAIDIDTARDWQRAEWLIEQGDLDMVQPGERKRPLPPKVELVVFDFDGVMTDDRVWVDGEGNEMIAANRSDGMGIAMLHTAGIAAVVISTEPHPVVSARCKKLNIPTYQGVEDKAAVLRQVIEELHVRPENAVYLGNDVNDLACFPLVGCAVATADAHPLVCQQADIILKHKGGYGAVRELCERMIK